MRAGMNMGLGTLLASTNPFAYVLSTLRSAGVSIVNQLLADQWAYQQRALALYPGQPAKCVLFQDSVGTIPVTAVEQPIGLALDLETAGTWDGVTAISSLPGTHMRQSTTSKRAMLSARVNLLQRTEEFSDAYWVKSNATVLPNQVDAPDGTLSADKLVADTGTNLHFISRGIGGVVGTVYSHSLFAKAAELTTVAVRENTTGGVTVFNIQIGTIVSKSNFHTANVENIGNGWYRCTISFTSNFATVDVRIALGSHASFPGDGVSGIYIWGADLRLSVDVHPSIPAYQRVTAATDYDTAGFPVYKRFDGVDDAYASAASLNLTGTDEVTVFAPITKESDAAALVLLESAAVSGASAPGSLAIFAPSGVLGNFGLRSCGTVSSDAETAANSYPSPRKSLLTGIGKISTDTAILRVSGVQVANSGADQGTGNYGNHTLFEGARNQISNYFRGETQGFLILGKNLTASQLAIVEKYINNLWKAY